MNDERLPWEKFDDDLEGNVSRVPTSEVVMVRKALGLNWMYPYLTEFFEELEAVIPPPEHCHHVMLMTRYGSEPIGWQPKLTVTVNDSGQFFQYFIDPEDFEKSPTELADEIAVLHAKRPENAQKGIAAGQPSGREDYDRDATPEELAAIREAIRKSQDEHFNKK